MVRENRRILSPVRLPIPPLAQTYDDIFTDFLCIVNSPVH